MAAPIRRRTRARELALQFLYTVELRGEEALPEAAAFIRHHTRRGQDPKGQSEIADYAHALVDGVYEHTNLLNSWIETIAQNWRLDRMAHIDRNVLRLAIFELLFQTDVPFKVVINEAIDIAKRFSTAQSGSFVNGILDRARVLIQESRERGEEPPKPIRLSLPRSNSDAQTQAEDDLPAPVPRPRKGSRPMPPRPSSSDPKSAQS
ncbi:MAG: transcription antitermination factor NusB [Planctomycetota bacterium]|nr:MAG: transcription antitermination factor NusB [Planctomycetota bacterium]